MNSTRRPSTNPGQREWGKGESVQTTKLLRRLMPIPSFCIARFYINIRIYRHTYSYTFVAHNRLFNLLFQNHDTRSGRPLRHGCGFTKGSFLWAVWGLSRGIRGLRGSWFFQIRPYNNAQDCIAKRLFSEIMVHFWCHTNNYREHLLCFFLERSWETWGEGGKRD